MASRIIQNLILEYKFLEENKKIIYLIEEILENDKTMFEGIKELLEDGGMTLSQIKYKLQQKGFNIDDKRIFEILQYLLVIKGKLVRKEYWDKETKYVLLDEYYHDSALSRSYYSFEEDNNETKKFILFSDPHIGNYEVENFKLIENLYNYGIINGINNFFCLGDLFFGKDEEDSFINELECFKEKYPNPTEIKTYSLFGNHDKKINNFLKQNYNCDLRILSLYKNNFYIIPRKKWNHNFNNTSFHFSHKLYYSSIINELKINNLEELTDMEELLDGIYDVQVCGHLHKGIIYTAPKPLNQEGDILFLIVPSTSNLNINGIVAYEVTVHDNKVINISLLEATADNKIIKKDEIEFDSKKNNIKQKIVE